MSAGPARETLDVRRAPEPPKRRGAHCTKPFAASTRFFTPRGPSLRLPKSREDGRIDLGEKRRQLGAEAVERFLGQDPLPRQKRRGGADSVK